MIFLVMVFSICLSCHERYHHSFYSLVPREQHNRANAKSTRLLNTTQTNCLNKNTIAFSPLSLHPSPSQHHQLNNITAMSDTEGHPVMDDIDPEEQIPPPTQHDDDSDSDLSEVDEALLENDLDNEISASRNILDAGDLKKINVHRRAVSPSSAPAAPKQQKRKRQRARSEDEDMDMEGVGIVNDRVGRKRGVTVQREKKVREVTPDEQLAPEELRKREFERRIQDAIGKKQKKKKKKDGMVRLFSQSYFLSC